MRPTGLILKELAMAFRPIIAALVLCGPLLLLSPADAQVSSSGGFLPPASAPGQSRAMRVNPPGVVGHHAHHRNRTYRPDLYPYYPYDYYETGPEAPPPPQRYLDEPPIPAAPAPAAKPVESMVVELRGDRWVRLTSAGPQE